MSIDQREYCGDCPGYGTCDRRTCTFNEEPKAEYRPNHEDSLQFGMCWPDVSDPLTPEIFI